MKFSRSFRLAFLSIFVLASLAIGVGTSSAATTLTFVNEPGNAGIGAALTTTDFNTPAGSPITVQASSGAPSVTVAVCLENASTANPSSTRCPFPLGDPGFSLGGATTRKADNQTGIATFSNLTVPHNGEFLLRATGQGGATPDVTDDTFRVYDDYSVCPDGTKCGNNKNFGSLVSDLMSANVSGQSVGTAVVAGALGLDSFDCGDIGVNSHAPHTLSFFVDGIPGNVTVTITVAQSFDHQQSENGSGGYRLCYVNDKGATPTTPVLLPNCSPSILTNCVVSINKRGNSKKAPPGASNGDVIITARVEDGRCL